MPKLRAEDARALSRFFFDSAVAVGEYRFANWDDLSFQERSDLQSMEWTLYNSSSDMTTQAIMLRVEDMQTAVDGIKTGTRRLRKAAENLNSFKAAVSLASKAITLAAAIMTGNAIAIAEAAANA